MSVLNKSVLCSCGRPKAAPRQWCEDCFAALTDYEKEFYAFTIQKLALVVKQLEGKITERRAVK